MASPLRTAFTVMSVFVASAALARAQSSLDWLAIHDGPQSQTDYGSKCAVDAGGNVYMCGRSYNPSTGFPPPPPTADFETVKFSPTGGELWTRRFDGLGNDDLTNDIAVDAAGNVYVTGYSWGGAGIDLTLIKYLPDGTLAWSRFYDGPGAGSDFGRQIAFDAASNAIVVGTATDSVNQGDLLVLSYSPSGQPLWSTTVDGAGHGADAGFALAVAPSGDIYAVGQLIGTSSAGDLALVKLNASGAWQWTRTVDGGSNAIDAATVITISGNDRIAIAGYATRSGTAEDLAVVEYDASGNGSALRTYDGPTHGTDRARAIAVDAGGVLWVLGVSAGSGSGTDFATLRYDAAGQLLTAQRYNGPANRDDDPRDLVIGSAGAAWACGYSYGMSGLSTDTDVVLVQYDAAGGESFANSFSTPGIFSDAIFDADLAPGGRIALAGWTTGTPSGGYDYLALQLDLNALPQGYCTGKVNSLGCSALVDFTGLSSASAASGFVARAANVRNNKNGLLFYGVSGSSAIPFQGGTLCVKAPIRRTPAVNSFGTPPPVNDCSGMFAIDLNAFAAGALGGTPLPALLVAGTQVHCQWWGRDPGFAPPNNTALSSGMSYQVLP